MRIDVIDFLEWTEREFIKRVNRWTWYTRRAIETPKEREIRRSMNRGRNVSG